MVSFSWVIFASVYLLFKNQIIDAKNERIGAMKIAHEQLSQEMSDTRDHFVALTGELESKHKQLLDLVNYKRGLESRLSTLTDELDSVISDRGYAHNEKRNLRASVNRLHKDLNDSSSKNKALSDSPNYTQMMLDRITKNREKAQIKHRSVSKRVEQLERRLGDLKVLQQELINRVQNRTYASVGEMELMVSLTGLDLNTLLQHKKLGNPAQGGPLIKLGSISSPHHSSEMVDEFETSLFNLEQGLLKWEGLQQILRTLPLTAPADNYYISSGFGKRRDPFTKQWAMHVGLDFAGPFKTPIRATSAGVVTYAATKGPYGRFIEIDHGLGIKTRYAHLHKMLVKRGQKVKFRQKIGMMGSTGRSTGSHVHYEVLFNEQPQNPDKFLKAGKYVFKD